MSKLWMKPAFGGMLSLAMLSSSAAVWAENLDTTDLLKRLESLEGQLNTLRGQNENLRSTLSDLKPEAVKPAPKLEAKAEPKELQDSKPEEKKEAALAKKESEASQEEEAIKPSAAPLPSTVKVDPSSTDSYYTYGTGDKEYDTLDEVLAMLGSKNRTTTLAKKPKPAVKPTPPPQAPQTLAAQANSAPLPDIQRSGRGRSEAPANDNDLAALGMAVETIPTPSAPPPRISVNPHALALADNAMLPSAAPMPSQPSLWGESQAMSQEKVIRNAYDSAYKTMLHDPAAAIPALRAFVRDHHNHPLAAQAQYWVGEALFGRRDYGAATEAFMRVLKDYKSSEHAPDAALKLGYSFYALKQWEFARRTLEDVTRFFPNTPASQMAIGRLEMMSSEGH